MNTNRKSNFTILLVLLLGLSGLEPALAQEVDVFSANPVSAEQGTVNLDVTITGGGFNNSAQVRFLVAGIFGGIEVNSVKVRGSKKLIANISIAIDADIDDFDIEIQMLSGRKGKGTGFALFSVSKGTCEPWPTCRQGDAGDGPNDHLYDVIIGGGLSGFGLNWQQESGNSWVNFKPFYEDAEGELNLSYFINVENGVLFDDDLLGKDCFDTGDVLLFQAILDKSRRGRAEGNFWFVGHTVEQVDQPSTQVLYRLRLFGPFYGLDVWPPLEGDIMTMTMTTWSMVVENQGKKIKNISCLGEGTFLEEEEVTIEVWHMNTH